MKDIVDFIAEVRAKQALAFKARIDGGLRCPMCGHVHAGEEASNDGAGFDEDFSMPCEQCGRLLKVERRVHVEFNVVCEDALRLPAGELQVGDQVLRGRMWYKVEQIEQCQGQVKARLGLSGWTWPTAHPLIVRRE